MTTFADFCRIAGLIPGEIYADGKWRRCATEDHPRKKNGSYKLLEHGKFGMCQNFAIHSEPLIWKPDGPIDLNVAKIDQAAIARRLNQERAAQVDASMKARKFYHQCYQVVGNHPYLEAHGLDMTGCYGLRVDADKRLVIPMMKDRNVMSVQAITADGEKKFWPGASSKGLIYIIERPGATVTVICEGLATGLALYAAMPMARVICAFTAGNLQHVPPPTHGMAVFAGDNDTKTVCKKHKEEGLKAPFQPFEARPEWCLCNPGRKYASEAASACGIGVAMPSDIYGTDWCDFRKGRLQYLLADNLKAREADLRRRVDGEIARLVISQAKFIRKTA